MTDTSTIDALLRRHAAAAPATTAVIDPENRLSYAELDQTSRELATRLITAGIRKGTRVGVLLPNAVTWVQLACAITRIGAVLVPLSTLLRGGELSAQLRTAAVQHVITTTEFRGRRYPEGSMPWTAPGSPPCNASGPIATFWRSTPAVCPTVSSPRSPPRCAPPTPWR